MKNILGQYKTILNSAADAANAYFDMEGGVFLLAWTGELIQELTASGSFRGALLTIQNLCSAVDIELQWAAYDQMGREEKQAWLHLFAESLMD